MERDEKTAESKLDFSKLLGFRNLIPVAPPTGNIRESSQEAFTKKGTESCVPL